MIDNQDILVDPMESLEYIVSAIDNNGCVSEINETPDVGWDGRLSNGDFAPAEVYTYLIEVEYPNSQTEVFKGTVTLIR